MNLSARNLKKQKLLKFIIPIMLFTAASLAGISCQEKGGEEGKPLNGPTDTPTATPITGPGSKGVKPVSTPVARRIVAMNGRVEPTPIPCDQRRQVQVELSQMGVDCAKYDFTALNQEAQAMADAELDKMKCSKGTPCTLFNKFYTFWTADCKNTVATVRIKGYSLCASNATGEGGRTGIGVPSDLAKPTNKITPAPVTMDSGENPTFGAIDDGTWYKVDINKMAKVSGGITLACPSSTLCVFTYMEKDPQAASIGVGDYGPVVQRAEEQAGILFNQYVCPTPKCTKVTPFTPLYTQWGLSGSKEYVTVDVYFMLTCK